MKVSLETICVRITNQCNLSCSHCRAGLPAKAAHKIDLEQLHYFISKAKSLGLKHISISGGEPTLDKRIWGFTKRLLDENFYVTITTNGTQDIISSLDRFKICPTPFLRINISLDGYETVNDKIRGEGLYRKAKYTARKVKQWLGWVGINTVITNNILEKIDEFIQDLNQLQINQLALITPVKQEHLIRKN